MEENNNSISYKIINIFTSKFQIKEVDEKYIDKLFSNKNNYVVNLNVDLSIKNDESKTINLGIICELIDKKTKEVIINHIGNTTFYVKELKEYFDKDKKMFNLPNKFIVQIFSLSITHSRALLASNLNQTMFRGKFFTPIVDPSNFDKISRN